MSIIFCVLAVFGVFLPREQPLYDHLLGMELARSPKSQGGWKYEKEGIH
jgi:hypothetical protein